MTENIMVGQLCSDGDVILPQPDGTYETYGKTTLCGYRKDGSKPTMTVDALKNQEGGNGGNVWILLTSEDDKTNSIQELFSKFLDGKFLLGFSNDFINPYLITGISRFDDKENSEIKLHYTQTRNHVDEHGAKDNCAWRTITWDLFDEFVPKNE